MKSAEQLAKEYVNSLPLGSYGKEFDAFMAGYIACLEGWMWPTIDASKSFKEPSDAIE
jgi:hypothetical protein